RAVAVTAVVPRSGCRGQGRGTAVPKKAERRLECTVMACWEEGYDEPWFLVTDLAPDEAEALWYGMRSWIEGGYRLLKRGGWEWQATQMTDPDRGERLWLGLGGATRDGLALGRRAGRGGVRRATVPATAAPGPDPADGPARSAPGRPPARAGRRRPRAPGREAGERPAPAREPRRRPTGTKWRLVGIFAQGLAVLVSLLVNGHELPRPSWRPEAWLEIQSDVGVPPQQPPTPIPKNPSP